MGGFRDTHLSSLSTQVLGTHPERIPRRSPHSPRDGCQSLPGGAWRSRQAGTGLLVVLACWPRLGRALDDLFVACDGAGLQHTLAVPSTRRVSTRSSGLSSASSYSSELP